MTGAQVSPALSVITTLPTKSRIRIVSESSKQRGGAAGELSNLCLEMRGLSFLAVAEWKKDPRRMREREMARNEGSRNLNIMMRYEGRMRTKVSLALEGVVWTPVCGLG